MLSTGQIPFGKYPLKERLSTLRKRITTPAEPIIETDPHTETENNQTLNPQSEETPQPAKQTATQKLDKIVNKTNRVLHKTSSIWPFTMFIDDLVIDENKINFVFRTFFWSDHIHSILIRDISDVIVETSVLFARIKVIDRGFTEGSITISYLNKKEAILARRLIQGLAVAYENKIDLSSIPTEELVTKIEALGQVKTD